jgi:hypothetical protein
MLNVDIIQLKTICYGIKIGFMLPQLFNSWSVSPGSHVPTQVPLITESYTVHNIGKITHYSLPFTVYEISFILQFLASNNVS